MVTDHDRWIAEFREEGYPWCDGMDCHPDHCPDCDRTKLVDAYDAMKKDRDYYKAHFEGDDRVIAELKALGGLVDKLAEAKAEIRSQHSRVAVAPGLECTCKWCRND
jgi:hypothetical protein